jgi:ribonucleoside-diphosphate reductase beta chain
LITNSREVYKPFEYPEAYNYWEKQQSAHWLPFEVPMTKDVNDWNFELSDSERKVLGQILKSFTQTEIHVNEYWSQKVAKWFPKPEIGLMTSSFSAMESVHTVGYAYLNDSLGLDEWEAFMKDPTAVAKLNRLVGVKGNSHKDIAKSLAIFSGCTEGVNLFSSFAILMSFSRFDLMNGLYTIVAWSCRDESLHSEAGCWLFRELVKEFPEILDDDFKKDIYDAFRLTVKLEDDFIDNAFSLGTVRGLNPEDLKVFIRERANSKLHDLGLKANWKNLDKHALERMNWFYEIDNKSTDFFARKVVDYSKSNYNVDNLFEGLDLEAIQ